jgi:putative transposase
MTLPNAINQRWSLDFVSDALSDGRRFRILCIVDDFSRECLATVIDTSLGGVRVVRELERLVIERTVPQVVVSDNDTELTSGVVLRWATGRLAGHYSNPASRCRTPSSKATTTCATNNGMDPASPSNGL